MKRNNKTVLVDGWLLGAVVLVMFCWTTADATGIHVDSFEDCANTTGAMHQYLYMANGDNLLIRVEGVDLSVVNAGYGAGYWHLGLLDAEGYVVGWAGNFSKVVPGREGRLVGNYIGNWDEPYFSWWLYNGERPTNAILVYDALDNGWDVGGGVVGSLQDLAEGDLFYWTDEILFNGVRGDVAQLPPYTRFVMPYPDDMTAYLPHMVVDPIPEPVTIGLLSPANQSVGRVPPQTLAWEDSGDFYDVYFGEDPNNLVLISENQTATSFVLGANDLDFATTYYWLVSMMQEQELIESEIRSFTTAGFVCQTAYPADLNGDCKVDLADMALFCQDWLKESNRVWPGELD